MQSYYRHNCLNFMDIGHYNSFSIIELVIQLISDLYQNSRSWDTPNYCIFGVISHIFSSFSDSIILTVLHSPLELF